MLRFTDISLHRGSRALFADLTFTLHTGWKCGVTGANGSGKSTLFALVRGTLHADGGSIGLPPGWVIAHVAQEIPATERAAIDYVLDGDAELRTVEEALARAQAAGNGLEEATLHAQLDTIDAWTARTRAARLLNGLGFSPTDETRPVSTFSGGWRMRLNLAQALMCRSDLLLLDEPTNHLDLDAVLWLEDWLRVYPGTLLLISHDRDFLDCVTDHILHLEARSEAARATLYTGNYSAFEKARAAELAREQASSDKQRREAAHMRDFVERFRAKASKARQAQSRLKMLERLPEIATAHVDSPFHFEFRAPDKLPSPLLVLDDGAAGYGDSTILSGLNLSLSPGDRIGLLGPNGAGKSTLIRLLAGELELRSGERIGARDLKIGYFAQHQLEQLRLDDNALTHLARLDSRAREQDLRDFLGGFGFVGDRALEPVAPFSGGEKARLVLALIVYQRPNLLLLDEPTNHLDLEMRHALALALQEFEGAMVVVSHDRYLLRSVTDRLVLVTDGSAESFDGDLDEDYPQWLAARRTRQTEPDTEAARTVPNRKEQRRQDADKRRQLQPLRNRLKSLEKDLERLGDEKTRIGAALADNALYNSAEKEKLKALLQEQGRVQQALAQTEAAWLDACEALETADRSDIHSS
jgi:ATP-binding cassette subfamily F protein 3